MAERARVNALVDKEADADALRAGLAKFDVLNEQQLELLDTIGAVRAFVALGPVPDQVSFAPGEGIQALLNEREKKEKGKAGAKAGGDKDAGGKKEKAKEEPKPKGKPEGKPAGEKKDKAPKENATTKACKKEGGKKGCSLQDMNGMGGISFFTVNAEEPKEWKYFEQFIEAMNAEPDPDASEERKGGAKDLAKLCLAGNADLMLMVCQVPKALAADKGITPREWVDTVLKDLKGWEELSATEEQITGQVKADPANEVFPLKIKDQVTANSFQFLRAKKVIPDSTDDDDDWVPDEDAMAEAIGSW